MTVMGYRTGADFQSKQPFDQRTFSLIPYLKGLEIECNHQESMMLQNETFTKPLRDKCGELGLVKNPDSLGSEAPTFGSFLDHAISSSGYSFIFLIIAFIINH